MAQVLPPEEALCAQPRSPVAWTGQLSSSGGDHAEWAAQAQAQLSSARALRREAQNYLRQGWAVGQARAPSTEPGPPSGLPASSSAVSCAEERLKRRHAAAEGIAATLSHCMEAAKWAIHQVGATVSDLQKCSAARLAALGVVDKRQGLRAKRPPAEQVRDDLEIALEQERDALTKVRDRLGERIQAGQDLLYRLNAASEEMSRGRHKMPSEKSGRPLELLAEARSLEASAARFCAEAAEVLRSSEAEADRASGKTVACIRRRVEETVQIRRELEREIQETRRTIAHTEQLVERLQHRLRPSDQNASTVTAGDEDGSPALSSSLGAGPQAALLLALRGKIKVAVAALGRPLEVLCGKLDKEGTGLVDEDELRRALRRTFKIPPSAISDAELAVLYSALDTAKSGSVMVGDLLAFLSADADTKQLQDQRDAAAGLLEQLRATRERLAEDLKGKTAAWRIDEACLRVTPIQGLDLDGLPSKVRDGQRELSAPSPLPQPPASLPRSRRRPQRLAPEAFDQLRARVRGSAQGGRPRAQLEAFFLRFDRGGSGRVADVAVKRALRGTLRIPDSVVSDAEIASLCATLGGGDAGTVGISDIVAFLVLDPEAPRKTTAKVLGGAPHLEPINKVGRGAPQPAAVATSREPPASARGLAGTAPPCGLPDAVPNTARAEARRRGDQALPPEAVQRLRSRIRAAASYPTFEQVTPLLRHFDRDGRGRLGDDDVRKALRRALRIPPSAVSDGDIMSVCGALDPEGLGVALADLAAFAGGAGAPPDPAGTLPQLPGTIPAAEPAAAGERSL